MALRKRLASIVAAGALLGSILAVAAVSPAAAVTCPSGFPYGVAGTLFPYCWDVENVPANGASYYTLAFVAADNTVADVTVINVTVTQGQFIGGTGTFGSFAYPRTADLVTGSPATIAVGSQLRLASSTPGTATVSIQYTSGGAAFYDSLQSFTFVLPHPTVKSDCLHGGWQSLTDYSAAPFTNQGACIKWVKDNT